MKKKFNIKQTDSGNFYTWVSEGSGKYRKKSKITGSTPNEVIIKATKWLKHIDEEKNAPYTVKLSITLDTLTARILKLSSDSQS